MSTHKGHHLIGLHLRRHPTLRPGYETSCIKTESRSIEFPASFLHSAHRAVHLCSIYFCCHRLHVLLNSFCPALAARRRPLLTSSFSSASTCAVYLSSGMGTFRALNYKHKDSELPPGPPAAQRWGHRPVHLHRPPFHEEARMQGPRDRTGPSALLSPAPGWGPWTILYAHKRLLFGWKTTDGLEDLEHLLFYLFHKQREREDKEVCNEGLHAGMLSAG